MTDTSVSISGEPVGAGDTPEDQIYRAVERGLEGVKTNGGLAPGEDHEWISSVVEDALEELGLLEERGVTWDEHDDVPEGWAPTEGSEIPPSIAEKPMQVRWTTPWRWEETGEVVER